MNIIKRFLELLESGQKEDIVPFEDTFEKDNLIYLSSNGKPFSGIVVDSTRIIDDPDMDLNLIPVSVKTYYLSGEVVKEEVFFDTINSWKQGNLERTVTYSKGENNSKIETQESYHSGSLYSEEYTGQLHIKTVSVDGVIKSWESYHSTGQLEFSFLFVDGIIKDGTHETFHRNGKLTSRSGYKDGLPEGRCETYYPFRYEEKLSQNHLRSSNNYLKGKLHGLQETFVENISRSYYKHGIPHGTFETFKDVEKNQVKSSNNFKEGKLDGVQKKYRENGKLEYEESYKNGVREGWINKYHENGQLNSTVKRMNGKKEGETKRYFESGKLRYEGFYKKGKVEGEIKRFFESGVLHFEGTYVKGKLVGKNTRYFENGQIEFIKNHKKGRIDGLQKYFDVEGNIINTEEDVDGSLVDS